MRTHLRVTLRTIRAASREWLFTTRLAASPRIARRYPTIHQDQPPNTEPLPSFRLFAIIGAWHEADVIASCVANAFEQGCERVYLVDNGSTDGTVEAAVEAGATLMSTFTSPFYDESLRIHHMESVTRFITNQENDEHVWWLWLDADEFACGPGDTLIRDYLASLDRRFRVVGARYLEHFPSDPADLPPVARDPLRGIPMCVENTMGFCFLGHRKHPLVRQDRAGPFLEMGVGFHQLASARGVLEPTEPIWLHHFPYRAPAVTRARLMLLCGDDGGNSRISGHEQLEMLKESNSSRRLRELESVYTADWPNVEYVQRFGPLVDWRSVVDRAGVARGETNCDG